MVNITWVSLIAVMVLSVAVGFLFGALFFGKDDGDDDWRG